MVVASVQYETVLGHHCSFSRIEIRPGEFIYLRIHSSFFCIIHIFKWYMEIRRNESLTYGLRQESRGVDKLFDPKEHVPLSLAPKGVFTVGIKTFAKYLIQLCFRILCEMWMVKLCQLDSILFYSDWIPSSYVCSIMIKILFYKVIVTLYCYAILFLFDQYLC